LAAGGLALRLATRATRGFGIAPEDRERTRPPIEVEIRPLALAIVTLRGEHDASTKPELTLALARATEELNVLVDLCECS
jgi:hypothetical protein